jgi:histidyl-tRNA synthetase
MKENNIKDSILTEYNELGQIAKNFGFEPIKSPSIGKQDLDSIKGFKDSENLLEKTAILRTYFEERAFTLPQPVMLYFETPFKGSHRNKKTNRAEATIVTLGSTRSVCECLIIQVGISILKSYGYKDLEIELNSIGDKESLGEFDRKINGFIRKNIGVFGPDLKQSIKKDPFVILKEEQKPGNIFCDVPKSIDFLSPTSREHFKEILEFLEIMNIPYRISPSLMGYTEWASETVFNIIDKSNNEILASGVRTNRLAKKIGQKKEIHSVFLDLSFKIKKALKKVKEKKQKPNFYLIQFGPEAKLKSFLVLEELLKAGVRVQHSIVKDKLAGQMSSAENLNIPYIILIGQREALENSVVIRNTLTRAQEIVPISELSNFVKKIKI